MVGASIAEQDFTGAGEDRERGAAGGRGGESGSGAEGRVEAESVQKPVALPLFDGVVMMLGEKTSLVDDFGVGKKGASVRIFRLCGLPSTRAWFRTLHSAFRHSLAFGKYDVIYGVWSAFGDRARWSLKDVRYRT